MAGAAFAGAVVAGGAGSCDVSVCCGLCWRVGHGLLEQRPVVVHEDDEIYPLIGNGGGRGLRGRADELKRIRTRCERHHRRCRRRGRAVG
jgi:hypothetical protein